MRTNLHIERGGYVIQVVEIESGGPLPNYGDCITVKGSTYYAIERTFCYGPGGLTVTVVLEDGGAAHGRETSRVTNEDEF